MQIKSTLRIYLTYVRITQIKAQTRAVAGMDVKTELLLLVGMQTRVSTVTLWTPAPRDSSKVKQGAGD